jgi:Outer membrane protein beta-barrel domain
MLQRILILMFFLTVKLCIFAQDSFKPSTHLGIHGGYNFSAVSFKPSVNQKLLSSNAFGIVFRHVSEPHIGIQFEVNVAGKGWKELIDSVDTYTRRLQTIDIPLTAVFIAGSRTLRIAFTIGPYVSYLIRESESFSTNDVTKDKPYYRKKLEGVWEVGFTGGVGIEIHTKAGAFALRASYNHGLNNIFPLNVDDYYYSASRNQVIHGGIMYMYQF